MVFVECNADEALISALGVGKREIRHSHSKGNVCRALQKSCNAIGLLDEDPCSAQPSYLEGLNLLVNEGKIRILYDLGRQNCVIILCPRLEEWVLEAARTSKMLTEKYGLPRKPDELHEALSSSNKRKALQNLIKELEIKSRKVKRLKGYLNHGCIPMKS
ncbi:MAG: hypothetical protein AB1393_13570 [Candidatus Edwardsbacteria bacterium]